MADFVETTNTKTSVRELTSPIADITTFNAAVQAVIDDNPFGTIAYYVSGVAHDGVEKSKESYTAKVAFQDGEGNIVGTVSAKAPTVAGFNAAITAIMADTDLATAMGGTAIRDAEDDSYSATLKCHDSNGEIYYVAFTRDKVRVSSYEDSGIVESVEIWADTVTALA